MSEKTNGWFFHATEARPTSRLICLPHAGGSTASFAHWRKHLPPATDLCIAQFPGRGAREAEPPITDPAAMVIELAAAAVPLTDLPYVLFGHSLGAILAFEVARCLRRSGHPPPCGLFVSASRAPRHIPSRFVLDAVQLPEDAFMTAIRTLGGLPEDLFDEPALREVVLATTRRDFNLVARYRYQAELPLTVPLTVLYGRADKHLPRVLLDDWRLESSATAEILAFDGGHFYLENGSTRDEVLALMTRALFPPAHVTRV
jgi:medium-chain acyl-[acyl-carrier-protein] hydrolase